MPACLSSAWHHRPMTQNETGETQAMPGHNLSETAKHEGAPGMEVTLELSEAEAVEGLLEGSEAPQHSARLFTLADAAKICGISSRTMGRKLKSREIAGATFDEIKGTWQIPLEGLADAGLKPYAYKNPKASSTEPDETSRIKERLEEALLRVAVAEARAADLERLASNLERSVSNFETTQKALLENQQTRNERIESEIAARVELEVMKALAAAETARAEATSSNSDRASGSTEKPKKRWGRRV